MENFKEFMINSLLSGGIGFTIGVTNLLISLSNFVSTKAIITILGLSALVGIIIGTAAKYIFELIALNIIKNMAVAYVIEGIFVIFMTWLASLLFGGASMQRIMILSSQALVLSYIITYIQVRYWKEVNKKLKEFQSEI